MQAVEDSTRIDEVNPAVAQMRNAVETVEKIKKKVRRVGCKGSVDGFAISGIVLLVAASVVLMKKKEN